MPFSRKNTLNVQTIDSAACCALMTTFYCALFLEGFAVHWLDFAIGWPAALLLQRVCRYLAWRSCSMRESLQESFRLISSNKSNAGLRVCHIEGSPLRLPGYGGQAGFKEPTQGARLTAQGLKDRHPA